MSGRRGFFGDGGFIGIFLLIFILFFLFEDDH